MKRKALAITLSALMTFSFAGAAFAEDEALPGSTPETAVEFSYEDIDVDVYDGAWVETGIGYDVYLPTEWVLNEVTDEQAEQGLVMMAGEEGGGANMTVVSQVLPAEAADYDLETLGADMAKTYPDCIYADCNGIVGVAFDDSTNCVSGFATLEEYEDGSKYLVTFVISPHSNEEYEEFSPAIANMISSISYTLYEDESGAESAESEAESEAEAVAESEDEYSSIMKKKRSSRSSFSMKDCRPHQEGGGMSMEALEAILTRRSTRSFRPDAVEQEKLETILEAARQAPSGGNSQTNHFLVIRDPEVLKNLARMVQEAFAKMEISEDTYASLKHSITMSKKGGYVFHYGPPVLIVVANRREYGNNMADCACAIENMMVAANALDLGSCWINQLRWLNEEPSLLACLRSLGMKEEERVYGAVSIGYPAGRSGLPNRRRMPQKGNEVTWIG